MIYIILNIYVQEFITCQLNRANRFQLYDYSWVKDSLLWSKKNKSKTKEKERNLIEANIKTLRRRSSHLNDFFYYQRSSRWGFCYIKIYNPSNINESKYSQTRRTRQTLSRNSRCRTAGDRLYVRSLYIAENLFEFYDDTRYALLYDIIHWNRK